MYKVQVTPLIGLPRFDGWAHVTTLSAGRVIWSLAVSGQHARNIGRDLLDTITAAETDGSLVNAASLYALTQRLIQDVNNQEGDISLACGAIPTEGKGVFITYQASITLKRSQKSGHLLQSDNQLKIIEGKIEPEDTYIFATQQAGQFLGEIQQKLEQGYDIDTIVTSITPSLHLQETTALSALAFVQEGTVEQTTEPSSEPETSTSQPTPPATPKLITRSSTRYDQSSLYGPSPVMNPVAPPSPIVSPAIKPDPELPNHVSDSLTSFQDFQNEQASRVDSKVEELFAKPAQTPSQPIAEGEQRPTFALGSKMSSFLTQVKAAMPAAKEGTSTHWQQWFKPQFAQDVYVGKKPNRKIIGLIMLAIVLGIVGASVGGYFFYDRSLQINEAQAMVAPLITRLDEARGQVGTDPLTARQRVQTVIDELSSMEASLNDKKVAQNRIQAEIASAQQLLDEISGQEEVSELPIFLNTREGDMDLVITHAAIGDEVAYFLDGQKKEVVRVNVSDKATQVIPLTDIGEIADIAVTDATNKLWILTDKISSLENQADAALATEIESTDQINTAKMLTPFGGALYVFNPQERMVFKYVDEDDGFADPTRWLRSAPDLNFEEVVSMVVDGDIWLTTQQGRIFRLRGGNAQTFEIKGLESGFNSSVILYTTETLENLYFLEPNQQRIVVLNKNGEFLKEVKSSSLAAASNLLVTQDGSKALAVSGSTVYEIGL